MNVKKKDGRSQTIPVKRKIKQHAKARVTKNVSDQLDGGEELQQSAMLAGEILRPVTAVSEKGAALFKKSVLEKKRKKYKVVSKENAENPKGSKVSEKQGTKGKRSLRNRKIKAFLEKRKTKKQTDNPKDQNGDLLGSKAKVYGTKAALTIFGILGGIMSLIALVAVPVILIITVLYNSHLALFLPPLSEGDTVQVVAESYVQEFFAGVEREANEHLGYDEGEIYYQDPYGNMVLPIPQKDILCVYMVKYGVGDAATVMNDKARRRLLGVVHVLIKDYRDMAVEYAFSEEQMELLEMMMQQ